MTNNTENDQWPTTLKLFLFGLSLIFTGTVLVAIACIFSQASANFGGVIIIGPIPIIFGTSENILSIILIAVTLMIIWLLIFFLTRRQKQRGS